MAGWKDFRELAAWQHSHQAKVRIYELIERSRIKSDFKLTKQLRESARSAPGNIAEGFGRFGPQGVRSFLRDLEGSLQESLNHLIDAKDLRLITRDDLSVEEHHVRKAINTATGLIRHLERTTSPPVNQKVVAPFFNRLDSGAVGVSAMQFQASFRCAIPARRLL